jgi:hypothetical protein
MSLGWEHGDRVELNDNMKALNFFMTSWAGILSTSEQSIEMLAYAFLVGRCTSCKFGFTMISRSKHDIFSIRIFP